MKPSEDVWGAVTTQHVPRYQGHHVEELIQTTRLHDLTLHIVCVPDASSVDTTHTVNINQQMSAHYDAVVGTGFTANNQLDKSWH